MILKGKKQKNYTKHGDQCNRSNYQNGICICGTHLKSEHINTLEHQKYQPPVSNQGLIATYEMGVKTEILGIDNDAKELLDEIDKYFNYHDRKCELIDYLEDINKNKWI